MMNKLPSFSRANMIRDVWAENLEQEFRVIRDLIADYPFVAMDTEFPGVVAKPVGTFRTTHEFYYQTLRCNVNLLKIIQLGITLFNEKGEVPDKICTWQFNFKFSLTEDIYAQDSIELLKNGGINFDHMAHHGIESSHFAELLITSGLVLNNEVHWLAFHAGYDFGYLTKLIAARELPEKEDEFEKVFHLYFPSVFDVKYLLRQTDISHSFGLDALGDNLGIRRIGTAHQAGSDSLLTGHGFFKLLRDRLGAQLPHGSAGILYGLNEDAGGKDTPSQTPNIATRGSPSQVSQTPGSNAFPAQPSANVNASSASPAMNMVMHGGAANPNIHQAHK